MENVAILLNEELAYLLELESEDLDIVERVSALELVLEFVAKQD